MFLLIAKKINFKKATSGLHQAIFLNQIIQLDFIFQIIKVIPV